MRVIGVLLLAACLACPTNAGSRRELLGKIVSGDDQSQSPIDNVKVVLDESGSHDISKDGGLFQLFLPDVLRAGDEVTITVTAPGYAVYEPPGGKLRIPADLERTRIAIRLLPKRSPKFLSDAQLRAFVERTAKDSSRQASQPGSKEPADLHRYLRDWAVQYGFSEDQVRAELDRWAAEVASRKASGYELALAAFAKNNFQEANERALDAAAEAEANLANLQKQQQKNVDQVIRAYRLAGDAAYNGLDFDKAASVYRRALSHTRDHDGSQWAALQVRIGNAEGELSSRSAGTAIPRHSESAIQAYSLALEIYTREALPRDWAMTQNNLGHALDYLALRSEGAQAGAYLEQAVTAYRNALQVYTREQLPQDWAITQNNLGAAFDDLAVRSEGAQAKAYLEQAVAAYRSALQVFTEADFPARWLLTMQNLARTYERKSDWSNARQSYAQLLRHEPGNVHFQAKIRELTGKADY